MFNQISLARLALMLLAILFEVGVIPTGIDGGGQKAFLLIQALAMGIAAGEKNNDNGQAKK